MDDSQAQDAVADLHRIVAVHLAAADIPSLVLKGPSTGALLYPGEVRTSADADVLIPQQFVTEAVTHLTCLGYNRLDSGMRPGEVATHSITLVHQDLPPLDLHTRMPGFEAPSERQWEALWRDSVAADLGEMVRYPSPPARALVVAVHAARNGYGDTLSSMDLRRAVERLPEALWAEAAVLAHELGSVEAMTVGLGLLPRGREILESLDVIGPSNGTWAMRARAGATPALRWIELTEQPLGTRIRTMLRELMPSPAFMRMVSPTARRWGPVGLVLAHVQRWVRLLAAAPAVLQAVRRVPRD